MRRRVREARVGHLATVRADGRPHVVPSCFTLSRSAEVLYSAVDAKPKSTPALLRLDNLRANPSASLLVDHWAEDWSALWWVRVDGVARILMAADQPLSKADLRAANREHQPNPGLEPYP